jgi:hypothetical protein
VPPSSSSGGACSLRWVLPYVDQPLEFWQDIRHRFGTQIGEVYCPLPGLTIGTGHPPQPHDHLDAFLAAGLFNLCVLLNPIVLPRPVEEASPAILESLRRACGQSRITSVTVSNLQLATRIRQHLPQLHLTASTLMDICHPNQVVAIEGICDGIVPSTRIMRDVSALRALRQAFRGRIRLLLNEACLAGCPMRVQHFVELRTGVHPQSLCRELLERAPWLRLTGAWVLPQHLSLFDGLYDELKLAGRVTLRSPDRYREVIEAYLLGHPLTPDRIGGGPASVLHPLPISEAFYRFTLYCGGRCGTCQVCRDYYRDGLAALSLQKGQRLAPAALAETSTGLP